jgi:asparagine synthase (glutamine-hydrolysing)
MCGIAGYIGKKPLENKNISSCLTAMHHRGPDANGHQYHSRNACNIHLLHTRLAILDLDNRSAQPFQYQNSLIVFNGEIYNYIEIRTELELLGLSFGTSGDTEVVAAALETWGDDAYLKFEGMWAMAHLNLSSMTLTLSRDRFGEKPFYIFEDEGGLYFSSEINSLSAIADKKFKVNQNHLKRYLVNGYKALHKTKETFFHEISSLEKASLMQIDINFHKTKKLYWDFQNSLNIEHDMSFAEAVDGTRDRLIQSMSLRTRSDVPLAFCMSGGIDSNSLISIAKRELGYDVHGFTLMSKDQRYEEDELVEKSVRELGIQHTKIPLDTRNFLQNLQELVAKHGQPISTISYYIHWNLVKEVSSNGYKISISGTAADELFTGYYDHNNLYFYEFKDSSKDLNIAISYWKKGIGSFVRNPFLQDPYLYINNPEFRDHIFLNNDLFSDYLKDSWQENFNEKGFHSSLLRNRMLNELFEEAIPIILQEDDLNAMSVSIENRSPFLDSDLFSHAYSIPTHHLISKGKTKSVLREAMRGIVPDFILDNDRKVGFNASLEELMDFSSQETKEFFDQESSIYEIVKKEKIMELISKKDLPNSFSKFLFNFINAKIFLDQQNL